MRGKVFTALKERAQLQKDESIAGSKLAIEALQREQKHQTQLRDARLAEVARARRLGAAGGPIKTMNTRPLPPRD